MTTLQAQNASSFSLGTCYQLANSSPISFLPPASDGRIPGWVSTPNVRGTWDIVTSCLATNFLCTYTLLCLNVPSPRDKTYTLLLRHFKWMFIAILAPEILLTYAAGQWSRARQSVDAFRGLGYHQWNMRMAFFADMGGFTVEHSDGRYFPLNAKQLHWLVANGHVKYPEVTLAEIWDKSKQDRLTKIITACQISYFVLHCIGRAAQQLPVTALELSTLAVVVCSLMTAYTWLHKPANVHMPVRLPCLTPGLFDRQENAWEFTPLDFVDKNMPGWSMNIQPFIRLPTISAERPLQRIPNDRFPTNPYGAQEYFLCFATLVFTGLHIVGWNFSFPSSVEQLLWRICSVALFAVTVLFWLFETVASWYRLGRWQRVTYFFRCTGRPSPERAELKEETKERDFGTLPLLWEFLSITPVALFYGVARMYLIVEALIELRNLEAEAYLSVDWSRYLPHLQGG